MNRDMTKDAWLEHVEQCATDKDDQKKQATRALTIEFGQPLVQKFRRRRPGRPGRRGAATPLFDPEQLTLEKETK